MAWEIPIQGNHIFQLNFPHLRACPKMHRPQRDQDRRRGTSLCWSWRCWPKVSFLLCAICKVFPYKDKCHATCAYSSVTKYVCMASFIRRSLISHTKGRHSRRDLRDALSSTKTWMSKEKGIGKVVLQCDKIL